MERILSPDERIKRAEELYYRRKIQATNKRSARVNVSQNKDFGLFKKMFLQIVICVLIYTIFYMIKTTNYIFSEDIIEKTNTILSYDINLQNIYNQTKNYINSFVNKKNDINSKEENNIVEEINNEENDSIQNSQDNDVETNENIGGENIETNETVAENLTQMEQDAKDIISSKSLIIPLKGTITSRYGLRNPTTVTVPKYHTGIDIAANEGTVYIASMSGIVEEVSSEGDYR